MIEMETRAMHLASSLLGTRLRCLKVNIDDVGAKFIGGCLRFYKSCGLIGMKDVGARGVDEDACA